MSTFDDPTYKYDGETKKVWATTDNTNGRSTMPAIDNPAYKYEVGDSNGKRGSVPNNITFKQSSGFWGRRTSLEKLLLLLVAIFFIVTIVLIIVYAVSKNETNDGTTVSGEAETQQGVCITKECVSAAARISNNIDYSVAPCDDFYQFACGGWMKENVIPEDKSSYNTFSILRDRVDVVLKNLLEQDVEPKDVDVVKKAKVLYASCMNETAIEEEGDASLKQLLNERLGGWPLLTPNWDVTAFNLEQMIETLNLLGTFPILVLYVGVDNKNSTKRILQLDQPDFGMPGQKYYMVPRDDKNLMAYENLIYGVGSMMGFGNNATARQEVKDIVDFEIRLANISVPDEDRRDSNALYNPMPLRELHGNYSSYYNWSSFVLSILASEGVNFNDITDDEIIVNKSPLYYERLEQVLKDTPKRTIANYAVWRIVQALVAYLGEQYKELLLDYRKVLYGTSQEPPRYQRCVSYTTSFLGLAVGNMFIKDNFQAEAKTMALEMIAGLHDSFNNLLNELDWMDDHTKSVAREKNEFISAKIGYPEEVTNVTYLNDLYSNYTYTAKYFDNVMVNRVEYLREYFRKLREPVDKNKWDSPPSTVNAFYSSQKNQIMFPAGILQPPFFSQTYPKSLNYGGIGVVIGHEITHGFDDRGRQYDKDGNLVQWWSDSAIEKFKTRAQCVVDQYGNFTVTEINTKLNGVNTQGENIADNGGLKQAFDAYRNWVTQQGKEEALLPGVEFTHDQLFFINFAQLWCNLMREGAALSAVRTGVHSPGKFRVIGSTQNSDDFAKAFKCPKNSYMNPEKKCRVW